MTIAAIVLAGGAGSRFVGDEHKLLVEFRGRPLAAWAIGAALEASFDQVYVVTGSVSLKSVWQWLGAELGVDDPEALGVTLVCNPSWQKGQATSLAVGVDRAAADDHDSVVVGLADQPFVEGDAWDAVAKASGPIATATFEGKRRPPVKLDRAVWPLLHRSGDEGARSLLKLRPDLVSEVPCTGNPIDIDTMEDLRKWS